MLNLKQSKIPIIGKTIGAFINVLYLTMPLFAIFAYASSSVTLYTVNLVWIREHISWLHLPMFIVFIIIGCLLLMLVNYVFIYPSYYEFLNKQTYKHNNPVIKDLELIKAKLGIINDNKDEIDKNTEGDK